MPRPHVQQILDDYEAIRAHFPTTGEIAATLTLAASLHGLEAAIRNRENLSYLDLHIPGLDGIAGSLQNIVEMVDLHGGK